MITIKVVVEFCNIYFYDIAPKLIALRTFLQSIVK